MDIVSLLQEKGHELKKVGPQILKTHCPFHDDNDASFCVYLDSMAGHCFGCGWHGTLTKFVHDLYFAETAGKAGWFATYSWITEQSGGTWTRPKHVIQEKQRTEPTEIQIKCMTIAMKHYHCMLSNHHEAIRYLTNRGICHPKRLHMLGVASGLLSENQELYAKLYTAFGENWREVAISCGLIHPDSEDRIARRIVVGNQVEARVTYLQARTLNPSDTLRYINPPKLSKPLFGEYTLAWGYPLVAIVEGAFDALPLHSIQIPALALLGSVSSYIDIIKNIPATKTPIILTDNDDAGNTMAQALLEACSSLGRTAYRLSPEPYKDPGEWAEKQGPEWVSSAMSARWMRGNNSTMECTTRHFCGTLVPLESVIA